VQCEEECERIARVCVRATPLGCSCTSKDKRVWLELRDWLERVELETVEVTPSLAVGGSGGVHSARFLVRLEVAALVEARNARAACIRLFASVDEHVRLEVAARGARVDAIGALKWLLASVDEHVPLEVAARGARVVALGALKRLLVRVRANVPDELGVARPHLAACARK
jgi:hypothetical protein